MMMANCMLADSETHTVINHICAVTNICSGSAGLQKYKSEILLLILINATLCFYYKYCTLYSSVFVRQIKLLVTFSDYNRPYPFCTVNTIYLQMYLTETFNVSDKVND